MSSLEDNRLHGLVVSEEEVSDELKQKGAVKDSCRVSQNGIGWNKVANNRHVALCIYRTII